MFYENIHSFTSFSLSNLTAMDGFNLWLTPVDDKIVTLQNEVGIDSYVHIG